MPHVPNSSGPFQGPFQTTSPSYSVHIRPCQWTWFDVTIIPPIPIIGLYASPSVRPDSLVQTGGNFGLPLSNGLHSVRPYVWGISMGTGYLSSGCMTRLRPSSVTYGRPFWAACYGWHLEQSSGSSGAQGLGLLNNTTAHHPTSDEQKQTNLFIYQAGRRLISTRKLTNARQP